MRATLNSQGFQVIYNAIRLLGNSKEAVSWDMLMGLSVGSADGSIL